MNEFVSRQDTSLRTFGPSKREIEEGQAEANSSKMGWFEEPCKELKVADPANRASHFEADANERGVLQDQQHSVHCLHT